MAHFDDEADIRCDDCGRPAYRIDGGILYMHRIDCTALMPAALPTELEERRCATCGTTPELVRPRRRRPYVRHNHNRRCPERSVSAGGLGV